MSWYLSLSASQYLNISLPLIYASAKVCARHYQYLSSAPESRISHICFACSVCPPTSAAFALDSLGSVSLHVFLDVRVRGQADQPVSLRLLLLLLNKFPLVVLGSPVAGKDLVFQQSVVQIPVVVLSWVRDEVQLSHRHLAFDGFECQRNAENVVAFIYNAMLVGLDAVPRCSQLSQAPTMDGKHGETYSPSYRTPARGANLLRNVYPLKILTFRPLVAMRLRYKDLIFPSFV
jgi:hypothetical protein